MMRWQAEVFSKARYLLGESPFYVPDTKMLSWVDILGKKVYLQKVGTREGVLFPEGEKISFDMGQEIGAAVPLATEGGYLVCGSDGFYRIGIGKPVEKLRDLTSLYEPFQRSNDAKADPKGRLFFGSSVYDGDDHEASGNLYLLDQGKITVQQANTKISNGMAWSRDQKTFYFSDSLFEAVFAYDYDLQSGRISNRRVLAKMENGVSDGLCIDEEDNLWIAIWGGRRVEKRSGRDGSLLGEIAVDAEHVTSCCFAGENRDILVITTSGNGIENPSDGCLFTCRVDAKGPAPDTAIL